MVLDKKIILLILISFLLVISGCSNATDLNPTNEVGTSIVLSERDVIIKAKQWDFIVDNGNS
jgi:uncharacterized protein YcfL